MRSIKKPILFFLLSILFSFPVIVSADIISPMSKGVEYCFQILNIKDYPDYVFISSHNGYGSGGFNLIHEGDCISPYFPETILAIKKYDFDKMSLGTEKEINVFNDPYISIREEDDKQREIYEEKVGALFSSPKLLNSGIEIDGIRETFIFSDVEKIVDVLRINNIYKNNFELVKSEVIYTYTDGKSDVVKYKNQETMPKPTRIMSVFWIKFILTFLIEFIVILFFIRLNPKKLLLFSFVVNLITFPLANILYSVFIKLIFIELGVFVVEFILLKKMLKISYPAAIKISLVANLITMVIGLIF